MGDFIILHCLGMQYIQPLVLRVSNSSNELATWKPHNFKNQTAKQEERS